MANNIIDKPDYSSTPIACDSSDVSENEYSLIVIAYVSMTLNLIVLLVLVLQLLWTVLQTCHVIHVTSSMVSSQKQISLLVVDEVVNSLLIVFTVYTCITLRWPQDYLDTTTSPPTSLLCVVCINLARYLFRSGIIIHCQLFQRGTAIRLIHHTAVILFLTAILLTRHNWWYVIIGIIMEMSNIIATMHRLMKLINRAHWRMVRRNFAVVEFVAIIIFRMLLPLTLLLLYVLNDMVSTDQNTDLVNAIVIWFASVFFSGFQVYQLNRQGEYMYKCRVAETDTTLKKEGKKTMGRPVLINSKNIKLNTLYPKRGPLLLPTVNLVHDLESQLKMVKNDLHTAETGKTNRVLLNKISNVNTDVCDRTNTKNCNKALIGHCNQMCTDESELLNEVQK